METKRVMILENSDEPTSLLKEILLTEGLADQVDLVNRVDQALKGIHHSDFYDLVIINLSKAWEQGLQLYSWLNWRASPCPVILIGPTRSGHTLLPNTSFVTVPVPLSSHDFVKSVRGVLQAG